MKLYVCRMEKRDENKQINCYNWWGKVCVRKVTEASLKVKDRCENEPYKKKEFLIHFKKRGSLKHT